MVKDPASKSRFFKVTGPRGGVRFARVRAGPGFKRDKAMAEAQGFKVTKISERRFVSRSNISLRKGGRFISTGKGFVVTSPRRKR